jgi:hypothetical protein
MHVKIFCCFNRGMCFCGAVEVIERKEKGEIGGQTK